MLKRKSKWTQNNILHLLVNYSNLMPKYKRLQRRAYFGLAGMSLKSLYPIEIIIHIRFRTIHVSDKIVQKFHYHWPYFQNFVKVIFIKKKNEIETLSIKYVKLSAIFTFCKGMIDDIFLLFLNKKLKSDNTYGVEQNLHGGK